VVESEVQITVSSSWSILQFDEGCSILITTIITTIANTTTIDGELLFVITIIIVVIRVRIE
jgi:hypothetical protein